MQVAAPPAASVRTERLGPSHRRRKQPNKDLLMKSKADMLRLSPERDFIVPYILFVLLLAFLILSGTPALAASDDHEHRAPTISPPAGQQPGPAVAQTNPAPSGRPNLAGSTYGAEGLPEPYSSGMLFNLFKIF